MRKNNSYLYKLSLLSYNISHNFLLWLYAKLKELKKINSFLSTTIYLIMGFLFVDQGTIENIFEELKSYRNEKSNNRLLRIAFSLSIATITMLVRIACLIIFLIAAHLAEPLVLAATIIYIMSSIYSAFSLSQKNSDDPVIKESFNNLLFSIIITSALLAVLYTVPGLYTTALITLYIALVIYKIFIYTMKKDHQNTNIPKANNSLLDEDNTELTETAEFKVDFFRETVNHLIQDEGSFVQSIKNSSSRES